VVQSGSTAHRRSKEILWNPTRARTQRQKQLRAVVSHGSSQSTAAEPPPLSLSLSLKPSSGEVLRERREAGAGEGRATPTAPDSASGAEDDPTKEMNGTILTAEHLGKIQEAYS